MDSTTKMENYRLQSEINLLTEEKDLDRAKIADLEKQLLEVTAEKTKIEQENNELVHAIDLKSVQLGRILRQNRDYLERANRLERQVNVLQIENGDLQCKLSLARLLRK